MICKFDGLHAPEMTKKRAVIVVSPRRRRTNTYTIVPLSITTPNPIREYHYQLTLPEELPHPYEGIEKWIKGDMLYTFRKDRLDCPHEKDKLNGKRKYKKIILGKEIMMHVENCIKAGLGL